MRRVLTCLLLLATGCARGTRPSDADAAQREEAELATPRFEHIYMLPVDRALAEATELMKQNGWTLHPMENRNFLLTQWRSAELTEGRKWRSDGDHVRYLVVGEPLAPRQSVVRIFRMSRVAFSNDAEIKTDANHNLIWNHMLQTEVEQSFRRMGQPVQLAQREEPAPWVELDGPVKGTRDLKLERDLMLRLESRPSLETLTGSLRIKGDDAFARDPSFYLKRWRRPSPETCERKVAGFQPLLRAGLTVLIGEQLGTREAPAAVGDLVCEATEAGLSVTLALSIPSTEQERIDAYVASPGAPPDQDALLSGDFWRKAQQDGRGSRAVMDLIDRVRALRARGSTVAVVAFDTDMAHGSTRDARMARAVLNRRAVRPNDVLLVLAGNAHTRLVAEAAWNENFVPMSRHLAETDPGLRILELGYAQGRRWGCDLEPDGSLHCDVMGITPGPRVAARAEGAPSIRMLPALDEGFHGFLDVGTLNASLPAIALRGHEPPPDAPAASGAR
ncbi:hypothetical protein [Pyxidicoccus xibeiensis]|uniref:hypothetical protein n=1 Tax=Pyxidicoccus xibeiensis TaxID=2906759 RepID=UPI0020A8163A|nr:hypothetical protein [Pyxidicoccus xibeiensis]MCP3140695.1 hypothetical protein [Pyxidicoccus xibeiensis]